MAADRTKLEADLATARRALAADPDDPDNIIWVGRRLGYLWRMSEAIAVYSEGIELHPDCARLYRHRGHRYISVRRFDDAIVDLEQRDQPWLVGEAWRRGKEREAGWRRSSDHSLQPLQAAERPQPEHAASADRGLFVLQVEY